MQNFQLRGLHYPHSLIISGTFTIYVHVGKNMASDIYVMAEIGIWLDSESSQLNSEFQS